MKRIMRIDARGAERSIHKVRQMMDVVADRLRDGRPYLLGDRFSAVDITFAAFASPMVMPAEHPKVQVDVSSLPDALREAVAIYTKHPAGLFALRVYREHRAA
jgi:glutathione S-transferase